MVGGRCGHVRATAKRTYLAVFLCGRCPRLAARCIGLRGGGREWRRKFSERAAGDTPTTREEIGVTSAGWREGGAIG